MRTLGNVKWSVDLLWKRMKGKYSHDCRSSGRNIRTVDLPVTTLPSKSMATSVTGEWLPYSACLMLSAYVTAMWFSLAEWRCCFCSLQLRHPNSVRLLSTLQLTCQEPGCGSSKNTHVNNALVGGIFYNLLRATGSKIFTFLHFKTYWWNINLIMWKRTV